MMRYFDQNSDILGFGIAYVKDTGSEPVGQRKLVIRCMCISTKESHFQFILNRKYIFLLKLIIQKKLQKKGQNEKKQKIREKFK